jgi:hypothetical protein
MTPHRYSDPIDHAFSYLVKHYGQGNPRFAAPTRTPPTRAVNVAVILARFGCDESTIVGSILRYVLEEAAPRVRRELEESIEAKFGTSAFAAARDAALPKYDPTGRERDWTEYRVEYLDRLTQTDVRTLDVVAAHEIHWCGSAVSLLDRLGSEYIRGLTPANHTELLWWYRSLGERLERRTDWPHQPMLDELRRLSAHLVTASRNPG